MPRTPPAGATSTAQDLKVRRVVDTTELEAKVDEAADGAAGAPRRFGNWQLHKARKRIGGKITGSPRAKRHSYFKGIVWCPWRGRHGMWAAHLPPELNEGFTGGRRGEAQRPTGSIHPDAPVISHEKDWGQASVAVVEALNAERKKRHPGWEAKAAGKKRKTRK